MPLYDYKCEKCGKVFEVKQSFADDKLTVHEGCGGHVERLISLPAIQFKGSGFYINDYAKKSESKPEGGAKPANGKSDAPAASTETSKESKPAASTTESAPAAAPAAKSD